MIEENGTANPAQAEDVLGKFKSVDALAQAYKALEAEFTRRSQRLKALEGQLKTETAEETNAAAPQEERAAEATLRDEELYRLVTGNEGVRTRILSDYFASPRSVPLMAGGGAGVTAPVQKPKNMKEASALALGYLKKK